VTYGKDFVKLFHSVIHNWVTFWSERTNSQWQHRT
jgi:hypothetical protein